MAKLKSGKRFLAVTLLVCLCVCLLCIPAFAMYYVHSEDNVQKSESKGAWEICLTVDESATGGGVYTSLIFIPNGGTVQDCLDEDLTSSNNQNGLKAIHSYKTKSLSKYLEGKKWSCKVYNAGSQKAGTQTTHTGKGTAATTDTALQRYDNVVITVKK
jgi:hypothetical protein